MTHFSDFFPLFGRTEADIRADFDARANEGLTPDDPEWVDTRPGSPFYIATQPMVIEHASAYDRMNEIAASGILSMSWGEYLDYHAESYGEERIEATHATGTQTFTGTVGTLIGTGVEVSPVQTDPEIDPPTFVTTESGTIPGGGSITLAIQAVEPGEAGNVGVGAITDLRTGVAGIASTTNPVATGGGAEPETDDALKERLRLKFQGNTGSNVASYQREALLQPGVGRVTVIPAASGAGTVTLVVLDDNGDPLTAPQVTAIQEHFDPDPALGAGWSPINHVVTVETATPVVINVSAVMEFEPGYSLDGTSGTVALRTGLERVVTEFLDQLQAGEDVFYNAVSAQFFKLEGVADINTLRVGTDQPPTGIVDIAIAQLEVAQAGTITLTE